MGGALAGHAEFGGQPGVSASARPRRSGSRPRRRSAQTRCRVDARLARVCASAWSAACAPKARKVVHLPPTRQRVGGVPAIRSTKWSREMRPVKLASLRGSGRTPLKR